MGWVASGKSYASKQVRHLLHQLTDRFTLWRIWLDIKTLLVFWTSHSFTMQISLWQGRARQLPISGQIVKTQFPCFGLN